MIKSLLVPLFIGVFTGFVLFSLLKAQKYVYSLSHPPVRIFSLNEGKISYTYKKFDFKTRDGLTLKAIDYMPKARPYATIITFHYLGGSKESIFTFIGFLLKNSFRVISFDFRNHGESDHDRKIKFCLNDDTYLFFDTIKNMGIKGPFGVFGFSMGATPALYAFERYPDIKAAVVDSGPLLLVKDYFKYVLNNKSVKNPLSRFYFIVAFLYFGGFQRMSSKMLSCLRNLRDKPILFIHGEKDNVIPINNALEAFNLVKSKKGIFLVYTQFASFNQLFFKEGRV